jgi:membrane fusion protein, multidrug efflux system
MQTFDPSIRTPKLDLEGNPGTIETEPRSLKNTPLQKALKLRPVGSPPPIRNIVIALLMLAGTIGIGILGYRWWHFSTIHQETDNAYVAGDINPINARIAGTVISVAVQDNQVVSPGTILIQLDPRDAEIALQQAKAALEVARSQANVAQSNIGVVATNAQGQTTQAQGTIDAAAATVSGAESQVIEAQAGIPAAQAQLAQIEAALVKASLDYDRYGRLVQNGAISQQQFEAAKATYDATIAQRNAARELLPQAAAKLVQAQKNLGNSQERRVIYSKRMRLGSKQPSVGNNIKRLKRLFLKQQRRSKMLNCSSPTLS